MENKMEEQLNLPSAKHNVRLNPGNSEEKAFRLVVVLMKTEMHAEVSIVLSSLDRKVVWWIQLS
jgi:hypothetical protein